MKLSTIYYLAMAVPALAHQAAGINKDEEYNEKIPEEFKGSWQKWHMKEEHGMDDADNDSVFKLHDTRNAGSLSRLDILRMYGLQREEVVGEGNGMGSHDETEVVGEETKNKVVNTVMGLMDTDNDGEISLEEWRAYSKDGREFPDFGLGAGHEYDFEEEYEKHHWNQYHSKDDPDVKVQHAEDIEHELLHHFHEIEHEQEDGFHIKAKILLDRIPDKFKI